MTPEQALWSEVLYAAVTDAIDGVAVIGGQNDVSRMNDTERARRYITTPNPDFNRVCYMAGLNPVAVREHVTRQIAKAPTPAELVTKNNTPVQTITHNGQTHSIAEWSTITGVSGETIRKRIRNGWTVEDTLATAVDQRIKAAPKAPHRPAHTITHNGQTHTITEWANVIGVAHMTLRNRLRKGWTIEAALSPQLARRSNMATQLARRGIDQGSTLTSVENYFLNLNRMRNAPAQTTNVVTAPNTAPNATSRAPVIEYAVPITASPIPPMKPTKRMTPATEPVISSFARNGRRQNCRQKLAATTAVLRTSAFKKSFMITGVASGYNHSKCSYPPNEMGVPSNSPPFQETGGGPFAQEITNLHFSQDCAA